MIEYLKLDTLLNYRRGDIMLLVEVNKEGIVLVKHFESLHDGDLTMIGLQPKLCPAGIWTEGYGRAMRNSKGEFLTINNTTKQQAIALSTIKTEEQAEQALKEDLQKFSDKIRPMIKVPLNSNQFSACVSLSYNIGEGAFSKSSVLKYINAKDFSRAAESFALWNKAQGKVLPGLTRRREAEKQLFIKTV